MSEQADRQLAILNRLARETTSTFGFAPRLRFICGEVRRLMEVRGVAIYLLDRRTDRFDLVSACGLSDAYLKKGPVLANRSLSQTRFGKIHYVADVANDPTLQYPGAAVKEGIVSILALPLMARDRFIGTLRLYTARQRTFTEEEIDFLTALCAQAAVSIENARIYETLQKQEAARKEFILMMTHELKSPLTAMKSILEVMERQYAGPLTEKQAELLKRLSKRIDSIIEVSAGIIDRFQWESRMENETGTVAVTDQLRKTVDLFSETADEKGITLEMHLPDHDPVVRATPDDLEQVVNNLVSNAVKYTSTGGSVRIHLLENAGRVVLEIGDSGIGISAADLPRIFEDRFRTEEARRIDPFGRGLGLSFVKKIVESLDGTIAVDSRQGEGSVFRVTFPGTVGHKEETWDMKQPHKRNSGDENNLL